MKKVISVVTLAVAGITAQAQVEQVITEEMKAQATENLKKPNVVEKIIDGFKESIRNVHQINKENLAEVKEASVAIHAEAVTNPDFEKFRQTKGFKNKARVVAENMREGCREASEKEKERRSQIQSHESYKNLLEEQRQRTEAIVNRNC